MLVSTLSRSRLYPLVQRTATRVSVTSSSQNVISQQLVLGRTTFTQSCSFSSTCNVASSTTGKLEGRPSQQRRRSLASFSMEGKVCVVTGAARGLGNVFARTLVESGANQVAILDLNVNEAKQAAKELENWIIQQGNAESNQLDIQGFACDVSNESQVCQVMNQIRQKYGKIDVAINSAGIVENYAFTEYPTERMQKLFDININGSHFVAREAAKHMLADNIRGSIVLVASMSAGIVNFPQKQTPYNVSKAAVRHMASSLAVELAQTGIRVNSLSPGYMLTSLTKDILAKDPAGQQLKKTWESMTPMGRMGDPNDLKGAIIYLASDASVFTTGTDLVVDGGYTSI